MTEVHYAKWRFPKMKVSPVLIHVLFGFSTKYTIQASYWGYPPWLRKPAMLRCPVPQNSPKVQSTRSHVRPAASRFGWWSLKYPGVNTSKDVENLWGNRRKMIYKWVVFHIYLRLQEGNWQMDVHPSKYGIVGFDPQQWVRHQLPIGSNWFCFNMVPQI